MKKFITQVLSEGQSVMYVFTETREDGLLQALACVAKFTSAGMQGLKDSLEIHQAPAAPPSEKPIA